MTHPLHSPLALVVACTASWLLACGSPSDHHSQEESSDSSESDSSAGGTESSGDGDGDEADGDDADTDTGGFEPCQSDEDCTDPSKPFCDPDFGQCGACFQTANPDDSCAALDPNTPVCEDGSCVQCTTTKATLCTGSTPICDPEQNTCEPCASHEQCPESACNLAAGNCLAPELLMHVDGDDPNCSDQGSGTVSSPFCTLSAALATPGDEKAIMLHERLNSYQETVEIVGSVALLAAPYQEPSLRGFNGTAAVTVTGNLFMRGVTVASSWNGIKGMQISGGSAWIEQSQIVNNSGGGIVVDGGGTLVLTNSFVGGSDTDVTAVTVTEGTSTINYSTLVAGPKVAMMASPRALSCIDGNGVSIRNSILVSAVDEGTVPAVVCPGASIANSVLESTDDFPDNIALAFASEWFVNFGEGDFHLSDTHPAEIDTAGTWQTGDPTTDIDGDPRPNSDGTPDVAGADLP